MDLRTFGRISTKVQRPESLRISGSRGGSGHEVTTYFKLATKIAQLQFLNRDHVLLFRGQSKDRLTKNGYSILKPSLFRLHGSKIPTKRVLVQRFQTLRRAERELVKHYAKERLLGVQRLKRQRILRWAILQHYDVCKTPLLDVTHRFVSAPPSQRQQTRQMKPLCSYSVYRI